MCIVIFTYVATTSGLRFAFSSLILGFCISYFQHSFQFYFQRDLLVHVYVEKEIVYFYIPVCTVLQVPATLVMVRNTQDHGKMVFLTESVACLLIYFVFVFFSLVMHCYQWWCWSVELLKGLFYSLRTIAIAPLICH